MQLRYTQRPPAVFRGRPPLLVLLHGLGGNAAGMADWARQLDPRFLCLSLEAPYPYAPDAYRWFDVEFRDNAIRVNVDEAQASRRAVIQIINDAVMGLGADPRRVYLLGFSQGATLAYGIALTAPRKLRGMVGIAGRVLPEFAALAAAPGELRHLTLFIQQGNEDPIIPLPRGIATRDLFIERGAMLGYREYDAAHEVTPAMRSDAAGFLGSQLDRLDTAPPP